MTDGRTRFVLRHGLLKFALPVFVMMMLYRSWDAGWAWPSARSLAIGVVVWTVAGVLFGLWEWRRWHGRARRGPR